MNKYGIIFLSVLLGIVCFGYGISYSAEESGVKQKMWEQLYKDTPLKDGVKEITYDQFQMLRGAKKDFVLVDVLSPESYANGHIEGAISFPVKTINSETAHAKLAKNTFVVVYCGGFHCHASTAAAKKLFELGYEVLDYKGGLEEWKERGNTLVK